MNKAIPCVAHGKFFHSMYEAKMQGYRTVLPLGKPCTIVLNHASDLFSMMEKLFSDYHDYADCQTLRMIRWIEICPSIFITDRETQFVVKGSYSDIVSKESTYLRKTGEIRIPEEKFVKEILI